MQITPPPVTYGFPTYQVCLYKPGDSSNDGLTGLALDCNDTPYFEGELQVEHCPDENDGKGDYQTGNFNKYIMYSTVEQDLCADCTPENPNKIQVGDLVTVKEWGNKTINGTICDITPYGNCENRGCNCEIWFETKNT